MNLFDDVIHILSFAGVEAASGRIEAVARKVGIGCFGAIWKASWSRVDILATTGAWVRHDGQQLARCDLCSFEIPLVIICSLLERI